MLDYVDHELSEMSSKAYALDSPFCGIGDFCDASLKREVVPSWDMPGY